MSAFIFFQASVTSANAFAEYAKSVPPTLIEYGGSIVTRCPLDNYGGPGNKVEMNDEV